MVLVRLVAGSDEWEVDSESKYYKTYFTSIEHLIGHIPTTIPIPQYVMDQRHHWCSFMDWLATYPRRFLSTHRLADMGVLIRYMVDLNPSKWTYIAVDERTPPEERRAHLMYLGRLRRSHVTNFPRCRLMGTTRFNLPPSVGLEYCGELYDPIVVSRTRKQFNKALEVEWLSVLWGVIHNSYLLQDGSLLTNAPHLSLVGYDWTVLENRPNTYEKGMGRVCKAPSQVPPLIRAYLGQKVTPPPLRFCWLRPPPVPSLVSVVLDGDGRPIVDLQLYETMLNAVTDDAGVSQYSLQDFGINTLCTGGRHADIGYKVPQHPQPHDVFFCERWNIPAIYHSMLIAACDTLEDTVELLGRVLGSSCLRAIVTTLKNAPPDERAAAFCSLCPRELPQ